MSSRNSAGSAGEERRGQPALNHSQGPWVADPPLDGDATTHRDRSGRRRSDLAAHPAIAESTAKQEQKDHDNDEEGRR
jgi:hypothetical protein